MSLRSRTRAAEQAVIEHSIRYTELWRTEAPVLEQDREFYLLRKAIDGYLDIQLEVANNAAVGTNHPETSHQAARSLPNIGGYSAVIFEAIKKAFDDGRFGLTADELEEMLAGKHQSVSARVNDLKNNGWIIDSGQRRNTRTGRKAIIWEPTYKSLNQ